MFGNTSERVAEVTASASSLPALMCSIAVDSVSNMSGTWPARRSASAGPPPRYGTWSMSTFGRNIAASTRPVLDDEGLTQTLGQPLSYQARGDVGRAGSQA